MMLLDQMVKGKHVTRAQVTVTEKTCLSEYSFMCSVNIAMETRYAYLLSNACFDSNAITGFNIIHFEDEILQEGGDKTTAGDL